MTGRPVDAYLIGRRYGHHATRSGYESFHRRLNASVLPSPPFRSLQRGWRLDYALERRLDRPSYTVALLAQELAVSAHVAVRRGTPHHLIYADTDLRFLGGVGRALRAPVVATFHEPLVGLEYMRVTERVTRGLAAAILMSESQREWFEPLMPADRVFVIHHGVDTDFFVPGPRQTHEPRILVVGSKYRDFDLLSSAADLILDRCPEARLLSIGTGRNRSHMLADPRFEYLEPRDDAELLVEYQRASVCVFPLAFATANNALLETMACGVPIVATDVGGTREYSGDGALLCAPDSPEALAHAVLDVLGDDELATRLGAAARARSKAFDFGHVAERHLALYRAVRN